MKFSTDDIAESLRAAEIGPDEQDKVLKKLQEIADQLAAEKAERNNTKKQFIVIANGPVCETPMWIVQTDEDFDHNEVVPIIQKAAKDYKNSSRRNKGDVSTFGEALLSLPKKDLSPYGVGLKTKEPVIVVNCEGYEAP